MVGAYSTFVNGGVHNEPVFVTRIEDKHGNLLASFTTSAHDAIDERTAYTMVGMLKNVVNAGTAGRLRYQYRFTAEMGGKTGTSQNASDAWFMGIAPRLVAGAWVGGEDRSVHLLAGGEGAVMALPIFAEFMQKVYADPKLGVRQTDTFRIPANGVASYDCKVMGVAATESIGDADEFFDR
jgi:penicillin-binding protein 1A